MARWDYTLNIRQHLGEDDSKESQVASAEGIRREILTLPPGVSRRAIPLCDELRAAAETGKIDWFNASLNRLWDWFDDNRIWVKL